MQEKFWITGLIAAAFTPMHDDGSLALDRVPSIVEQLIVDGVDGLYLCGSTGEGPSLSAEERMAVTEAYIAAVKGRIPVVVQVGHNSLGQARRLAAHAQASGADAISSLPPSYFKVASLDVLIDCLQEVTEGAPDLPFYYYHIPRLTATPVDIVEFLLRAGDRLPTLVGVKYSDFQVYEFQAATAVENGRFNLLFGSDEMLLSGLVGGAHGAVGSTYNFATPLYKRIIAAYEENRIQEAQQCQAVAVEMIRCIASHSQGNNALPALKAVMGMVGVPCGKARLPLVNCTAQQESELRVALEASGFFEWGRP
jgi:N-acetylneuraminate lyase